MLYITDNCTDPYRNLAEEEFLFTQMKEPVFRLWRNDNAIIVGRYQNTLAEIDYDYVKSHNIKVVRRLTGGGAVFHDLGNLNFTFIQERKEGESTSDMFKRFTSPIIDALNSLGIKAYLEGRNDLLIDGKKFSGNAVCTSKNRILQHGTLLFDSSMTDLSAALKTRPEKFSDKAVKSNRSRVTNIKDHLIIAKERAQVNQLSEMPHNPDVLWFRDFLGDYICSHSTADSNAADSSAADSSAAKKYILSAEENKTIDNLRDTKYSQDSWNFGNSPEYAFSNAKKFKGGIVEVFFSVGKGIITELEIKGDYFFSAPTEDFVNEIIGTPHTEAALAKKIGTLNTDACFSNISADEILSLFF